MYTETWMSVRGRTWLTTRTLADTAGPVFVTLRYLLRPAVAPGEEITQDPGLVEGSLYEESHVGSDSKSWRKRRMEAETTEATMSRQSANNTALKPVMAGLELFRDQM